MNSKQILSIIGVLVVLILIAAGLSFFGHAPAGQVAAKSPILGGVASTTGYEYVDDAPYYTIKVTYPATTSLDAAASAKVTTTIEQGLADAIAQFKKDGNFENLTAEDIQIQNLGGDRKYVFEAGYTKYESQSTVSYMFIIYQDTLGAHPNGFYRTFVFDKLGNQLKLSDLFVAGSDYLTPLSKAATIAVTKQLQTGLEMQDVSGSIFADGLTPKDENFQNFILDGDTLHIYIPPYQAAAYVAGSFDVAIPLSQLSGILKPEYK